MSRFLLDGVSLYPVNTKHLYNIYAMLVQRRINIMQMFCVSS